MNIKINHRDVAPQNVAEAALEKEICTIQFELNEQFSFDKAFEAMISIGAALGRVRLGATEKAEESEQLDLLDSIEAEAEAEAEVEAEAKSRSRSRSRSRS